MDVWSGNIFIEVETGEAIVFDPVEPQLFFRRMVLSDFADLHIGAAVFLEEGCKEGRRVTQRQQFLLLRLVPVLPNLNVTGELMLTYEAQDVKACGPDLSCFHNKATVLAGEKHAQFMRVLHPSARGENDGAIARDSSLVAVDADDASFIEKSRPSISMLL